MLCKMNSSGDGRQEVTLRQEKGTFQYFECSVAKLKQFTSALLVQRLVLGNQRLVLGNHFQEGRTFPGEENIQKAALSSTERCL